MPPSRGTLDRAASAQSGAQRFAVQPFRIVPHHLAMSAAALLGVIPMVAFFVIFQRSLTRGVTAGAVK